MDYMKNQKIKDEYVFQKYIKNGAFYIEEYKLNDLSGKIEGNDKTSPYWKDIETSNYVEEAWLPINQKDFGNYLVSNLGRIMFKQADKYNIIPQCDNEGNEGYLVLDKNAKDKGNFTCTEYVYRMVAYAWLGKIEGDGLEVHHINNNGYDNRVENLILLTKD